MSKAAKIREFLHAGDLSVEQIAARVGTSIAYVRTMQRYQGRRTTSEEASRRRKQENQDRFLQALMTTHGILSDAARKAGLATDRPYVWMKEDPEFKEKVYAIKEMAIDFVESSLFRQIRAGVPASTIFFLKTRAKHRGYVERTEMTGPEGRPMEIRVITPSPALTDPEEQGYQLDTPIIEIERDV